MAAGATFAVLLAVLAAVMVCFSSGGAAAKAANGAVLLRSAAIQTPGRIPPHPTPPPHPPPNQQRTRWPHHIPCHRPQSKAAAAVAVAVRNPQQQGRHRPPLPPRAKSHSHTPCRSVTLTTSAQTAPASHPPSLRHHQPPPPLPHNPPKTTPTPPQDKPHPRGYVALSAATAPTVDGRLDEPSWRAAPWSEPFLDIVGPSGPAPWARARVKMLWDARALYVGAELEDRQLFANQTLHDSIVYQDNNFEVGWGGLGLGWGRWARGRAVRSLV